MTKRIEVETVKVQDSRSILTVNKENDNIISGAMPSGRILSDSDGLAFIYILESKDEFVYISIRNNNWPGLKDALDQSLPFILKYGEEEIELEEFEEELKNLLLNIEGNANYGKNMVDEVEKVFL